MVENNKSSSVICLEQALSKNHFLYSFDSYILGPLWLDVIPFGTQGIINFIILNKTYINQMTYYFTIIALKARII
jgi:hypothetical protein